jgi:hypothetical protein
MRTSSEIQNLSHKNELMGNDCDKSVNERNFLLLSFTVPDPSTFAHFTKRSWILGKK